MAQTNFVNHYLQKEYSLIFRIFVDLQF